jgi:hypothetical protein
MSVSTTKQFTSRSSSTVVLYISARLASVSPGSTVIIIQPGGIGGQLAWKIIVGEGVVLVVGVSVGCEGWGDWDPEFEVRRVGVCGTAVGG